jgi:hypothetical protein
MKKSNLFGSAVLMVIIFALAIAVQSALALSVCHSPHSYAGRSVQSCKENYTVSGNVYWKGRMISRVNSGGAITQLGWNSWTDTRYCAGVVQFFQDHGSSYGSNSTQHAATSGNHTIGTCPAGQLNESRVFGIHRWQQTGYTALTEEGWSLFHTLP